MTTVSGFRGSSSDQASTYKKQGHTDEKIFSDLIGGIVKKGEHTGKTDVIGPDGKTYSVKGGEKKWQIFLYAYDRIKNDKDFHQIKDLGINLVNSLDSFPNKYVIYEQDKKKCLSLINEYIKINNAKSSIKDISLISKIIDENNSYFSSKLKLMNSNKELLKTLENNDTLRFFLDKSIFNLREVDRISIKMNNKFLVFDKSDVLDILSENLSIKLSSSGNRKTDLNIDGQKIIMFHKSNIVELEVRNDSDKHFRQLRFNMIKPKAVNLLIEQSELVDEIYPSVLLRRRIN
jgi:hypothetical protein